MKVKVMSYRENTAGGATKAFVDVIANGTIGLRNLAIIEDGTHEAFVGSPSVPSNRDESGYRQVITGMSKDFQALVMEAAAKAASADDHKGEAGETAKGEAHYAPHVTPYQNGNTKGLASLTVGDKDAEHTSFTINGIRLNEVNDKGFIAVNMPSTRYTDAEGQVFYNDMAFVTDSNKKFINGLIMGVAKEVGIIGAQQTETPDVSEALEQTAEKLRGDVAAAGTNETKSEKAEEVR